MNVTETLDRLKEVAGLKGYGSDSQLARLLNVTPQTLDGWKRRNSAEWQLVFDVVEKHKWDLQYIITGKHSENHNKLKEMEKKVEQLETQLRYAETLILKKNPIRSKLSFSALKAA